MKKGKSGESVAPEYETKRKRRKRWRKSPRKKRKRKRSEASGRRVAPRRWVGWRKWKGRR